MNQNNRKRIFFIASLVVVVICIILLFAFCGKNKETVSLAGTGGTGAASDSLEASKAPEIKTDAATEAETVTGSAFGSSETEIQMSSEEPSATTAAETDRADQAGETTEHDHLYEIIEQWDKYWEEDGYRFGYHYIRSRCECGAEITDQFEYAPELLETETAATIDAQPSSTAAAALPAARTAQQPATTAAASAAMNETKKPAASVPVPASTRAPAATAATVPAATAAAQPTIKAVQPTTRVVQPTTTAAAHVHNYGAWTVAVAPSCTTKGREVRSCPCGKQEEREIAALGHAWHTEKIKIKDAWDEKIKIQDAWDEQVLIQEAWTEEIKEVHWFCAGCGMDQDIYCMEHGFFDANGKITEAGLSWTGEHAKKHALAGESGRTYQAIVTLGTIDHPARYQQIHHDAVYINVRHEAEYKEAIKCSRCGTAAP